MGRRFSRIGVTVALGLAALTSACTMSSPPPVGSSSTSAASSSSTTPTTSAISTSSASATAASGTPEAAKANSAEGASAFTRFFFQEVNRGYNAMTTQPITQLSSSTCRACTIMRDSVDQWNQKGYHYVGDFITPTFITASAFPGDQTAKVLVTSKTAESKLLDTNNSLVQSFPAEDANSVVSLTYQDGHWITAEVRAAG